jgi:hypothetical protein
MSPAASDDLNMFKSSVFPETVEQRASWQESALEAGCPLVPEIIIFVKSKKHQKLKIPEVRISESVQREGQLFCSLCHMVQCGREHLSKAQRECRHSVWGQVSGGCRNRDPVFLIRQLPGGAAHERTEPQDKDAGHLKGMGGRLERKLDGLKHH